MAVVAVIAAYIALAQFCGVKESWIGTLFLTQWAVVDGGRLSQIHRTIIGALVGTMLALVPSLLSSLVGYPAAITIMLVLILLAVFLFISGRGTMLVNAATMVFLSVISVPYVTAHATPMDLLIGFAFGVLYFGGLAFAGSMLQTRRSEPA